MATMFMHMQCLCSSTLSCVILHRFWHDSNFRLATQLRKVTNRIHTGTTSSTDASISRSCSVGIGVGIFL